MAQADPHLPFDVDPCDPNFVRDMRLWSFQTKREIHDMLAATKQTIATSKTLMVVADRILARN
jgi:hypothetical protein